MSTTETETHTDPVASEHGHGRHPTTRDYVNIAAILAVLTALEVSTYFVDFGPIAIPMLIVLMIVKFLLVVGWFMHLRFDSKLFGRLMYTGLGFAVVLYAITLAIFALERAPTA